MNLPRSTVFTAKVPFTVLLLGILLLTNACSSSNGTTPQNSAGEQTDETAEELVDESAVDTTPASSGDQTNETTPESVDDAPGSSTPAPSGDTTPESTDEVTVDTTPASSDDQTSDTAPEAADEPTVGTTPSSGGDQTNDPATELVGEEQTNDEPISEEPDTPDPVVPDPMIQNSTRVRFDIQVPAYQSDTLQVGLTWGDEELTADWVGDEFWSVSEDLPTNTEHLLAATFYDRNGTITLGSFEQPYKTGTNASESLQITANQFDTSRWDADGDGVSNIDELIAGTYDLETTKVLLFSETKAFRHESIEAALTAVEALANGSNIQTDRANDSGGVFTDENLANYSAVIWVLTSGDVLNIDEQAAFERYIRSGKGYAGIHAASDTEYDWPWYGNLVGAYFERHPAIQSATQIVENANHVSTKHLSATWTRTDEWYDFGANPRSRVNVLLTLDENSYVGGGMGNDHPIAWYHNYDGGRSWYTGGGHTEASYSEPDFLAHLHGGLLYAAGVNE